MATESSLLVPVPCLFQNSNFLVSYFAEIPMVYRSLALGLQSDQAYEITRKRLEQSIQAAEQHGLITANLRQVASMVAIFIVDFMRKYQPTVEIRVMHTPQGLYCSGGLPGRILKFQSLFCHPGWAQETLGPLADAFLNSYSPIPLPPLAIQEFATGLLSIYNTAHV